MSGTYHRNLEEALNRARALRTTADGLYGAMDGRVKAITNLENEPETLPRDEFTDTFLMTVYQAPTEVEGQGSVLLNEAAKLSVMSVGVALANFASAFGESAGTYAASERANMETLRRTGEG